MRLLITSTIAALMLGACSPSPPQKEVGPTSQRADISVAQDPNGSSKSLTIDGKSGRSSFEVNAEGRPPEDAPSYIPVYAGGQYKQTIKGDLGQTAASGGLKVGMIVFTTTDSPQKVLDFYKAAFQSTGMKQDPNDAQTLGRKIAFLKDQTSPEGAQVVATADPQGQGTLVQISFMSSQ
jgi:hypothetical protein